MTGHELDAKVAAAIGLELEIMACRGLGVRWLWVRQAWLDELGLARVLEIVAERGGGAVSPVLGASWQDPGVQADG